MQQNNYHMDFQQQKTSPMSNGHQTPSTGPQTSQMTGTSQGSHNSNVCMVPQQQQQPTNYTYNVNNMNNVQIINQHVPNNQNHFPQNASNYIQPGSHHQMGAVIGNQQQFPGQAQMQHQAMAGLASPSLQISPGQNLDGSSPMTQEKLNAQLNAQATGGESSVFFGNVAFNFPDDELMDLQQTVGSIRNMKMMQKDDSQSRGFGFCTYNDLDTATSAIRNLNKININNREIKVDFADDAQNGTNLKREEVTSRDRTEIINTVGGSAHVSLGVQGGALKPQKSSVTEMMQSMDTRQKEMLIFAMQDASSYLMRNGTHQEKEQFIDALAQDEVLLNRLFDVYSDVAKKLTMESGESNTFINQGGLWNMQTSHQTNNIVNQMHPNHMNQQPFL